MSELTGKITIQESNLSDAAKKDYDFILHHQRFAPLQEGKGPCMICECPKYDPSGRFKSNEKNEYSLRSIQHEEPEERCSRCGRLLENHKDVDHPFRGPNS